MDTVITRTTVQPIAAVPACNLIVADTALQPVIFVISGQSVVMG